MYPDNTPNLLIYEPSHGLRTVDEILTIVEGTLRRDLVCPAKPPPPVTSYDHKHDTPEVWDRLD